MGHGQSRGACTCHNLRICTIHCRADYANAATAATAAAAARRHFAYWLTLCASISVTLSLALCPTPRRDEYDGNDEISTLCNTESCLQNHQSPVRPAHMHKPFNLFVSTTPAPVPYLNPPPIPAKTARSQPSSRALFRRAAEHSMAGAALSE